MKLGSNLNGLTFPPSTNFGWPGLDGWPRPECTIVKLRGGIFKSGFRVAGIVCWSNSEHSEHSQYVESKVILQFQFWNSALLLSCPSDLTLFLPGEGGISPLIVYHVTTPVRNRVKEDFCCSQRLP